MDAPSYDSIVAQAREAAGKLVDVERHESHALVRLNEPSSLNALSAPLTIQLNAALSDLAADPKLRSIVITGADPAFSAGGDLRLMKDTAHPMVDRDRDGAANAWRWIRYQFGGIVRTITRNDRVFVAAVNGAAAGVGLAIALACDIIVVSDRARLVPAFGRIGLLPEVGTSWLLTRRLGYQKAFEFFLSGKILSAEEACALGLANELVTHAGLLPAAQRWCERAATLPAHAVTMTKPLLRACADMTWDQAITMEEFAEPMCFTTQSHREAVRRLLEQGPGRGA